MADKNFVIDENGILIKYKGKSKKVIIPEGIKAIGKEAFYNHSELKSLTLSTMVI